MTFPLKRSSHVRRQAEKRRSFFGDAPHAHMGPTPQHLQHQVATAFQAATAQRAA